ncbi:hypothetical protein [Microvirga calopogonii]|uniref:hypothetical protein n=1 Tax=Microvirga calopogonii TaxID=2078013 RepID=UPI000E0DD64D|nr:hypothetical protein [Microvirga calopogonii]
MTNWAADLAELMQALRKLIERTAGPLRNAAGHEATWLLLAEVDWREPRMLTDVALVLADTAPEIGVEWAILAKAFRHRLDHGQPPLKDFLLGSAGAAGEDNDESLEAAIRQVRGEGTDDDER